MNPILLILMSVLPEIQAAPPAPKREPGVYATFTTSLGPIVCVLYEKQAPVATANFTGLARGTKEWKDPKTGQMVKRPLYNGTVFHRVIPGFMIQGGDPLGSGFGGPGYSFKDEIDPSLKFDKPGILAMANSGPNTNGSQFFITEVPYPSLNDKYTILGRVIEGQDLIGKIAGVPRDTNDKPRMPVVLQSVRIQRFPIPAASPTKAPAKKTPTKK